MCRCSEAELNWVRTYTRRSPELMQLEMGTSTSRYLPPRGTARLGPLLGQGEEPGAGPASQDDAEDVFGRGTLHPFPPPVSWSILAARVCQGGEAAFNPNVAAGGRPRPVRPRRAWLSPFRLPAPAREGSGRWSPRAPPASPWTRSAASPTAPQDGRAPSLPTNLAGLGAEVVHLYSASSSWSGPRLSPPLPSLRHRGRSPGALPVPGSGGGPGGVPRRGGGRLPLRPHRGPALRPGQDRLAPGDPGGPSWRPRPRSSRSCAGSSPRAWLVGWKYEVEGDRRSAVERARRQLEECATDLSVANGPAYGEGCALVGPGGEEIHLPEGRDLRMALASRLLDPG